VTSSPAVISSPIVSVTKAPVIPVTEAKAAAPVVAPAAPASAPASATQTPLVVPAARHPTLVGTAPLWNSGDPAAPSAPVASAPVASAPVASAPVASAAVASAPVASAPVAVAPIVTPPSAPEADLQIDVEVSPSSDDDSAPAVEVEAPPDSKPSGIGQKYVPKEEGAPAVMLGPEVQAAESGQSALLEAEHRARRAPTIVRMQAFDLPPSVAQPGAAELEFPAPRRSRAGVIVAASAALLIGIAVLALTLGQSSAPDTPQPPPVTAAPLAATPDTKAPVPPPVSPTPAAASPHSAEPRVSATAAPLVTPKLSSPAPKPVAARSSPPAKAVTSPKTPATKSATGGTKQGGKSMIVRENPF